MRKIPLITKDVYLCEICDTCDDCPFYMDDCDGKDEDDDIADDLL